MSIYAPAAVATRPDQSTATKRTPLMVRIGEIAVADDRNTLLVTHALGSSVAVCIWDPEARIAGMLHFLLPDAPARSIRPFTQPGAFADTGIPLLFETAFRQGLRRVRTQVSLVGGAEMPSLIAAAGELGRSNVLAARGLIWANDLPIARDDTGGMQARSVYLCARTGRLRVRSGSRPCSPAATTGRGPAARGE